MCKQISNDVPKVGKIQKSVLANLGANSFKICDLID